ncbi:MAG: hypothetical protein GY869_11630 [Planctomycetes bacterium]|nr:hypothetical protein [Planctomycetota bacterium]
METYFKILIVAALLLVPTFFLMNLFFNTAYDSHLPLDPTETISDFFTCLQDKPDGDYFRARELLETPMKMPMIMDSGQINYINENFDRIRRYLIDKVGPDFATNIQVESRVFYLAAMFDNDIILRCSIGTKWSVDEKHHYSLKQVIDFPLDYFPMLGVEERNRDLNLMIESLDKAESVEEIEDFDNIDNIIAMQSGEPPFVRLERLITTFHYSVLDVQHAVFDAILEEFPDAPATWDFLREITEEDYGAPVHLEKRALDILKPQTQPVIK